MRAVGAASVYRVVMGRMGPNVVTWGRGKNG